MNSYNNSLNKIKPEKILKQIENLDWYRYISKVINFLNSQNYSFYFVGGIIRDIIFSLIEYKKLKDIKDIDIAIETEDYELLIEKIKNIDFGKEVTIKKYSSFLTASIFIYDDIEYRIDISIPRKEIYPKAASLPVVKKGSINDDFFRRDFTINAIGLRYLPNEGYTLFDPFNGLEDILNRKIRILHSESFIDDPTRIIRAIRFAATFNFKLEKDTEKCLKDAINKNVLGLVSNVRLANEFINILYKGENLKLVATLFKKHKIIKFYNFINRLVKEFIINCKKIDLNKLKQYFSNEDIFYIRLLFLLEKTCGNIQPFETKIQRFKEAMISLNLSHQRRIKIYQAVDIFSGKMTEGNIPSWVKKYSRLFKRKIPILEFKPSKLKKYNVPDNKLSILAKYLYINKIKKVNKHKIKVILDNLDKK